MTLIALLAMTALLAQVTSAPVDAPQQATVQRIYPAAAVREGVSHDDYYPEEEQGENDLQRLEKEVAQAETANLLAGAIQAEQKLEEGILSSAAAVAIAGLAPGPPGETAEARQRRKEAAAEEMEVLEDMVDRDKRAVEVIQGILGGSSGGGDTAAADSETAQASSGGSGSGGSGSIVFSLISSFLRGSSSSSSGGANTEDEPATDDGTTTGRQFSALGLITSSVSTVLRIKFSIFRTLFSLVQGLFSASTS